MIRAALLCAVLAGAAFADAPVRSDRPVGRPGTEARGGAPVPVPAQSTAQAPAASGRPPSRPVQSAAPAPAPAQAAPAQAAPAEPRRTVRRGPDAEDAEVSSRPSLRPRGLERGRLRGSVCGDPDLKGEFVGAVAGRLQGCGIEDAVRVTSVSGIALSTGSLMNCRTARALKAWTEDSAVPSLRRVGGGLRELRVAAHYSCRTINNQPGGRLSEHGKGSAIDISAFRLNDGTELTLLGDWNSQRGRAPMRAMFRGACGPFSTVIGPDGDRFHLDHFHFDTAQRRSGFRYCR